MPEMPPRIPLASFEEAYMPNAEKFGQYIFETDGHRLPGLLPGVVGGMIAGPGNGGIILAAAPAGCLIPAIPAGIARRNQAKKITRPRR